MHTKNVTTKGLRLEALLRQVYDNAPEQAIIVSDPCKCIEETFEHINIINKEGTELMQSFKRLYIKGNKGKSLEQLLSENLDFECMCSELNRLWTYCV